MTSQYSQTARQHPGFESARQRDKRRAKEEIHRYLDECARQRHALKSARILPVKAAA